MFKEGKLHLAKYAPPPPDLPVYQQVDPRDVSFIGRTNYEAPLESKKYVFGIKRGDRRRHVYIIGKIGVGKSKMLELMIRQDIAYGHGVCLFDPHGDIVSALLDFIPEERIRDVVLIDPTDTDHPIAFNPLCDVAPEMKHQLTQGIIEAIQKQFGNEWTLRVEHMLRCTLLALLDYPDATLKDIVFMLTDSSFRANVVRHIGDEMAAHFFSIEFEEWSRKFDTDAISPLINKLSQFLSIPMLKHIFSQKKNSIDFAAIMNERKILLINLAKGKIGEQNASFLGSILVAKIKTAGVTRCEMPEEKCPDFYFYADEFHDLVTPSFLSLFTEARKYGINLAVAHQYTAELTPAVMATILGNVANLIVFRVGGEDAEKLEAELTPVFKAKDMLNLGSREFYIKETVDGETYDPFSAETLSVLPPGHSSYRDRIIEFSRKTYGTPIDR